MAHIFNMNTDISFDLNSLFNLNYNFDILKNVIENLFNSNKLTNKKISDVFLILDQKEDLIKK